MSCCTPRGLVTPSRVSTLVAGRSASESRTLAIVNTCVRILLSSAGAHQRQGGHLSWQLPNDDP